MPNSNFVIDLSRIAPPICVGGLALLLLLQHGHVDLHVVASAVSGDDGVVDLVDEHAPLSIVGKSELFPLPDPAHSFRKVCHVSLKFGNDIQG